jgi:hypothetical protein
MRVALFPSRLVDVKGPSVGFESFASAGSAGDLPALQGTFYSRTQLSH